jgi:hypothetical protein
MVLVPIPITRRFVASGAGSAIKLVRCEQCACEFVYLMRRRARAGAETLIVLDGDDARKRAMGRLRRSLLEQLRAGHDLVPCPQCGWYQRPMRYLRRMHLLKRLGIALTCVLLFIGLIYPGLKRVIDAHPTEWTGMWIAIGLAAALVTTWILTHDVNGAAASRSEAEAGPRPNVLRRSQYDQLVLEGKATPLVSDVARSGEAPAR